MICLDTSVLIDLLRGNEAVTAHLSEIDETRGLCYPVACELYKGVYKSSAPEKGEREVGGLVVSSNISNTSRRDRPLRGNSAG